MKKIEDLHSDSTLYCPETPAPAAFNVEGVSFFIAEGNAWMVECPICFGVHDLREVIQ